MAGFDRGRVEQTSWAFELSIAIVLDQRGSAPVQTMVFAANVAPGKAAPGVAHRTAPAHASAQSPYP
jgi:hypothetical protein